MLFGTKFLKFGPKRANLATLLVSAAQIEGKVTVTPKSWMLRNNRKKLQHFRGICPVGLWSAIARGTKEYTWPTKLMDNFYVGTFWSIDWKVLLLDILSIQCKIRRDRPTDAQRSTGRSQSTCWPPCCTVHFSNNFKVLGGSLCPQLAVLPNVVFGE